jgi:hypothetical protein
MVKQRIYFYADDAMVTELKAESERTGAPIGEIVRRRVRRELPAANAPLKQPVLVYPRPTEN